MKASEILVESTERVDEAPVGMLSRLFTNIGAKMGLSGAQIQKEVNQEMMRVKAELNPVIKARGQIKPQDLMIFLDKKGYGGDSTTKVMKDARKKFRSRPNDPLYPDEIDYIIKQAVVNGYAQKGGFGTGRFGQKSSTGKAGAGGAGAGAGGGNQNVFQLAQLIGQLSPQDKQALFNMLRPNP